MVKHLPTMQETQLGSPGPEDPLEKEPTPVLLPTKSHGQRSVVGYSPWGCKESDTAERLHFPVQQLVGYRHPLICTDADSHVGTGFWGPLLC